MPPTAQRRPRTVHRTAYIIYDVSYILYILIYISPLPVNGQILIIGFPTRQPGPILAHYQRFVCRVCTWGPVTSSMISIKK